MLQRQLPRKDSQSCYYVRFAPMTKWHTVCCQQVFRTAQLLTNMINEATEILAESDQLELPTVTIVGRPNVGKSTFFNKLTGSRKSIAGDLPGITRDRIYGTVEWRNRMFRLVDTGGIIPDDEAVIPREILIQAKTA